jgi:nucleotide-binding universal stress UspA family protein
LTPPVILLASEHTEFDVGAERLAVALARRYAVPLHCVRVVVTNPEYEVVAPQLAAQAEAAARSAARDLADNVREGGAEAKVNVRRGADPWQEIVAEAKEIRADLLVIRRRGKRAVVAQLLVGDMVQKVITHAPCDVLVVPRAGKLWQRGVLAAIDGSPISARVVDVAVAQARDTSLPLLVVRACSAGSPDFAAAQASVAETVERAKAAGVETTGRVVVGKVFTEILSAARDAGADLLVIGWHGAHAVRYAVLGGTAEKVIGLAECPVLVVKG